MAWLADLFLFAAMRLMIIYSIDRRKSCGLRICCYYLIYLCRDCNGQFVRIPD